MPKYDVCHEVVAEALRREGWDVEDDFPQKRKKRLVYIDLRASRSHQAAFIEVKCFSNLADPNEQQYIAVGQYLIYQSFLRLQGISNPLYLAVPVSIYENKFDDVILNTIQTHQIKLLLFDGSGERKLQWIEW